MKKMSCKRLLALVLAAAMILSLAPQRAYAEENGNLALGKSVTVSSYEDGTNFDGSKITDGDLDPMSRWGTGQNAGAGEWAEIDLGKAEAIKQIDIYFERSDAEQNILSYQVEFYADGAYTTVYTKAEKALQHECIVLDEAKQAEKVKITILDADGGTLNWVNVGIVEVELYGDTHAEELPANPNIALGRPATASNVEGGTSFTADKAVDGSTAASSRWATDQHVVDPWIEIDLDDGSVIKQVNFMFERAGANQNILAFRIEAEINGTYETVYTYNGGRPDQRLKVVLDEAVTADKMKVVITNYDGGTSNWASVSIIEIEVYSFESVSLGDIAQSLNAFAGTVITGDTFVMPEAPAGTTIELNGADFEQIIAKDGTVQHPLTDKTVNVSFKVSDGENSVITGDIPVTVQGLYTQGEEGNAKPVVIPEIQEWYSDSIYKLPASELAFVTYDDAALEAVVAEFIADYEAVTGRKLQASQGSARANAINFSLTAPDALLGDEGYTMQIDYDRINVASGSTTGNMYGMQTILQMVKTDSEGFAVGQMRDYPRYTIRGLLLDMARKPIAMTMVGDIARTMRYYKMNDLQLHLNDNYIWLEEYGTYANEDNGFNAYEAFRLESSLTNAAGEDPTAEDYAVSKEEMRTFIQTQRLLGMNIVPEIDVPAHAMAFTKVWPELSIDNEVRNGHTLIDHFNLSDENAVAKIKEIFDDYTKDNGTVPATFDGETTVHVGADEYYLSGKLYREYFNDIVPYIKQTNTVRIWGSLTQMNDNNQTKIIPEAIEDVQMNIWSAGWANFQDMFDMGFGLINTIDVYGYMVPNGNGNKGGYGDYLNLDSVFSSYHVNQVGGITLPSSDDRVLGAAFAIWNDNIDRKASGLTESDIFVRFFNALPLYAEKTWAATGQEKGSADAITKLAKTIGVAPNTDPYFQLETEGETHAAYAFETMLDASGNGRDLIAGTATVADGFLTLTGGNSYVGTPIKKIGNLTSLSFDITLTEEAQPGMILFETTPEYYTHDIRIMDDGTLGFTRELYDYSFGYTLPVGETVHIEIVAEPQVTSLYVDGELVGTATGKFVHNGEVKKSNIGHSTFALPLERIGSETNSIKAIIENLSVDKVIVKDYSDDSRDIPVEVLTATAGDWQTGYEATEGPAELVLDGDPNTIWHTDWYGTSRANHWIQFELSEDYTVDGLRYLPRSGSNNGVITKYEIQISNDGENFETIASGSWANNKDWKAAEFEGVQPKFVRLVAVDAVTDNSYVFASAAEIRLTGVKAGSHEHSFGEWTVTTEPTCTEKGIETRTCECGETETREVAALGHDFVNGECTRCDAVMDATFEDVAVGSFFFDPVEWAVEEGITTGATDTTFNPNGDLLRAQFVTFLWRAAGEPEPASKENPFTDVTEKDFFYKAVLWAVEEGITTGTSATTFSPMGVTHRAQAVTFLWRYLDQPTSTATNDFTDVVAGMWYEAPINWAVENGVTNGMGDGTFGINNPCNRAHAVT
ncbi:MAG: discoidin domain-containing protein, partial [Oscillospiraceae bacterium]|nr:discoidin domain-containing protein [Oscillospiraceae bacterium]